MEQGLQQVPRRVATGYFSLIFFIVLCLALIAACAVLALQLLQKSQDLATLQRGISQNIEDPLKQKGKTLPTEGQKDGSTLIYGPNFFNEVSDLVQKGVNYSALTGKTGYGEGPAALDAIDAQLAGITPKQANLKELVTYLDGERRAKANSLTASEKNLAEARNERERKQKELEAAQVAYHGQVKSLQDQIDKERADSTAKMADYYKKWNDANTAWKDISDKFDAAEKKAREDAAAHQATLAALNDEVGRLREELLGRKPILKPGAIGKVARTDLVHGFAIIDRGSRDGIAEGQELLVYRPSAQGKKLAVGKLVVVRVFDTSSRADILSQEEMRPIIPDDLLFLTAPE